MSDINKEIKFLNRKRNLIKQPLNKNITNENNIKKDLKTYEELKKKAKEMLLNANSIIDFENCINLYDVDEDINIKYLDSLEQIDKEKGFNEFIKYQYTINYNERIRLIEVYAEKIHSLYDKKNYCKEFNLFQKEKLENVFFDLLKYIGEEKEKLDLNKLFLKLCKEFYIETVEYKIPIIYGNEELFFAHMINSIYNFFITNRSYPIFNPMSNMSNMDLNNIKIKKRKSSMITKVKDNSKERNEIKESEIETENTYIDNNEINFSDRDEKKFLFKFRKIQPLIKKYISKEFQDDFKAIMQLCPNKKDNKKMKYTFLSFFELFYFLITKLVISPKDSEFEDLYDFFYETKSKKLKFLKLLNIDFGVNFYYTNDVPINLNNFQIKNEEYIIEINKMKYKINFNNYVIQWLYNDMLRINSKQYENCLNNIRNYSLQGCIFNNRCFNDINIFNLFKDDINKTLNNSTLKEAFDCIIPFTNYNYPFNQQKFLKQINEIIYYIPFLNNNILGITFRNLGLIIINRNIFDLGESNDMNKEYFEIILKICFGKITVLHECNFHYILKIIASQNQKITCKTPCKYFSNYRFKKYEMKNSKYYDGGDYGETLIFGEKIYQIFLPGAEKILEQNFWGRKNIDFAKSGTDFININNTNNNYHKNFREISEFTDKLYKFVETKIKSYNDKINYEKINLGTIYIRMRRNDKNLIIDNKKQGEVSLTIFRNYSDVVD